ncbi:MAG: hypothetical protein KatS3mg099_437 [Candidatus Parcubacteria bacterium]|nr:MAG: hypothetical protein KatS3mg099_437 [Candidatus Parcubacteria bacterium]
MRGTTQISRESAREAGRRLGRVLDALCAMVAPGLSTAALEAQARALIAKEGGRAGVFGVSAARRAPPISGRVECVDQRNRGARHSHRA